MEAEGAAAGRPGNRAFIIHHSSFIILHSATNQRTAGNAGTTPQPPEPTIASYSIRSASTGEMRVVRNAGISEAASPTIRRNPTPYRIVGMSNGRM